MTTQEAMTALRSAVLLSINSGVRSTVAGARWEYLGGLIDVDEFEERVGTALRHERPAHPA